MKRAEYIRKLSDEELAMYLYYNKNSTRLGYKKLIDWIKEEINPEEERK